MTGLCCGSKKVVSHALKTEIQDSWNRPGPHLNQPDGNPESSVKPDKSRDDLEKERVLCESLTLFAFHRRSSRHAIQNCMRNTLYEEKRDRIVSESYFSINIIFPSLRLRIHVSITPN